VWEAVVQLGFSEIMEMSQDGDLPQWSRGDA
jgi:hypothetical protein